MNEEKRKNARLQGRFSDEPKPSRKDKSKRKSDDGSSKRKSLESKSVQPADGFDVQFDEQASDTFAQYEEKKPAIEINKPGELILSNTQNGESRVIFEPDFLPGDKAEELMILLKDTTKWYDKNIIVHGEEVPQPRLVAWYGPFPYSYSGAVLDAAEMPPAILEIKQKVESYLETKRLPVSLNSVLLNLYRDGKDSVAWHSDDELTMGVSPTIASVSLGEIRKFQMKIKPHVRESVQNLVSEEYFVNLTPGSLLIMDGCMQTDWKHQVPKEYHDRGPRINLTFRTVYPIENRVPLPLVSKAVDISNHSSSTKPEEKTSIFDNTNFPSLESANSQNESNSQVLKNSCAKSKSKAISNAVNQSENSLPLDSSDNSNGDQEIKDEPIFHDASADIIDGDSETDAVKETNQNDESMSTSALAGSSSEHTGSSKPGVEHPDEESNQASKRYELNADADEFIPKCTLLPCDTNEEPCNYSSSEYYKLGIIKFPDLFRANKVPPPRYDEFFTVVIEKLEECPEFFVERDYYEVETLFQLYQNGLSEKNKEVVLERICSMIKNAIRKNRNFRPPPPRSGYRNTYTRSRVPYKSGTSRERDYKD